MLFFSGEFLGKLGEEYRDIFSSFPQRRNADVDRPKPVEEVGAEMLVADFAFQVLIRCSDHADIDPFCGRGADEDELPLFSRMRRNFTWVGSGSSPISSRKIVPPSAISKISFA